MARNIHAETDLDLELREDRVAKGGDRNDDEVVRDFIAPEVA